MEAGYIIHLPDSLREMTQRELARDDPVHKGERALHKTIAQRLALSGSTCVTEHVISELCPTAYGVYRNGRNISGERTRQASVSRENAVSDVKVRRQAIKG